MRDNRGLTLVEVVLSLAIVGMMVGVLFTVLRMGHRAEDKGAERLEVSQKVMVVSDRLSWLLAGAYPYRQRDIEGGDEYLFFEGGVDSIGFVTTSVDTYSRDVADMPGMKYVRLGLDDKGLGVSERPFYSDDESAFRRYVLDPDAASLEIEYLEPDPDDGPPQWVGNWDTDTRDFLPLAVLLRITTSAGGRKVVVPPIIVSIPTGGDRGVPVPQINLK